MRAKEHLEKDDINKQANMEERRSNRPQCKQT